MLNKLLVFELFLRVRFTETEPCEAFMLKIYVVVFVRRRARENGGMLTKLQTEKSLQRKELWRRLKTGQVFYKPQGNYVPVGFERDSKLLNTK